MAFEPDVKLYVTKKNNKCDLVRKLLEMKGITFSEIDAEKTGILPYLSRDLGMEKLPGLLTPEGVFSGIQEILVYLKANKGIYYYLDQK